MKAVLYSLSLVALVGGLYFSSVSKKNLKEQQSSREATTQKYLRVKKSVEDMKDVAKQEGTKLTEAKTALEELKAKIVNLESDERNVKGEKGEVEGTLESQKAKLLEAEEAIQKLTEAMATLGVDGPVTLETIQSNIESLKDEKKALDLELAELETNIGAASKNVTQNRDEIKRQVKRAADREARVRNSAREAVITAVDNDWGFVIIGAGAQRGFTPQTSLLVKRDGRVIGRVKPTSIEPNQTIANINEEAMAPGVILQPGDRVILANPTAN